MADLAVAPQTKIVYREPMKIAEAKAKGINPRLVSNKVFCTDWDAAQFGLTDEELLKFQEIYAMSDSTNIGYLGRRQFTDLLKLLSIMVEDDQLEKMFTEMDENGDGQIQFDEFVQAMAGNLDPEQLAMAASVKAGQAGTSSWKRGEIVWAANSGIIIVVSGMGIAGFIYFEFVLVPLSIAYFMEFLVAPLMNLLEFRPIDCKGKVCCGTSVEDGGPYAAYQNPKPPDKDGNGGDATQGPCYMGAMPHGLSVLVTLLVCFGTLGLIVMMVSSEVSVLLDDDAFIQSLKTAVDDAYASLNDSGIKVLREEKDGYTMEEIMGYVSAFSDFFALASLILLLWVYLITEKFNPTVFDPTNAALEEIENQAKYYIALKTALSFVTGVIVAIILVSLQVKLAVMFGLLSFLLNFIPNVGSMIAMVLPLPIVIVDDNLSTFQKVGAFAGPGAVQGYVGNALEPMLFGKSLNMTPLSILAALVIWGSLWGLLGAILSVPLLGIQKILLQRTNHPIAKYCVMLIREDPTIDEAAEQ